MADSSEMVADAPQELASEQVPGVEQQQDKQQPLADDRGEGGAETRQQQQLQQQTVVEEELAPAVAVPAFLSAAVTVQGAEAEEEDYDE